MEDGEIVILRADSLTLIDVATGQPISREIEEITEGMDAAQKGGYAHFMLKEIHEQPQVAALVDSLRAWDEFYCLGYGSTYPIALEGALKLKEITYAHCEGMLSTEFKHGPLAAVRESYPVLFVSGPEDVPLMISGINETTVRGGETIVIAEEDPRLRANAHKMITLPAAGPLLTPLLAVLPLQLLSYQLSLARGYDPDFPRNLSKTLTVD